MRSARLSLVTVMASVQLAAAQPAPAVPPLVGAQPVLTVATSAGFVDDAVAVDGDRVLYVIADGTNAAALHVATVGTEAEQIIDVSTLTLQPIALQLLGQRALVIGINDGKQVAGLVELSAKNKRRPAGTIVWRVGPADHITPITRDGKPRLAVHRRAETTGNTTHTVELVALDTGRRVRAGKTLAVDASGIEPKLEFRVNHWSEGWTRAHGIKAGTWNRKDGQKTPDTEGTFDLVTGKLEAKPIEDLFEHKRRYAALAESGDKVDFVRAARTGSTLELWRGGKMKPLELDGKLTDYDGASLQTSLDAQGGWLALKIDPVNADAVARKRADAEYLDIFQITDGKATRKARVLAKGLRHRFGGAGPSRFWLIERNAGAERGGKSLTLYQLP